MVKKSFSSLKVAFLGLSLILALSAQGQQTLNYSSFSRVNGLPSDNVYSLVQDSSGILWLGTDLGLVRYDGVEANIVLPKDKRSLVVLKLFKDTKERIWFSTFHNGIYFIENGTIKEPPINSFIKSEKEVNPVIYVRDLYVADDDHFYFTFHSGHNGYYHGHIDSSHAKFESATKNRKGNLFFVKNEKKRFFLSGRYLRIKEHEIKPAPDDEFTSWSTDYGGDFAFANYGVDHSTGLAWSGNLLLKTNVLDDTLVLKGAINDISLIDRDIFVSTNKGLYLFRKQGDALKQLAYHLKGKIISKVIRDDEGVYWASTVGSGCLVFASLNSKKIVIPYLEKVLTEYSDCFYSDSTLTILNNERRIDFDLEKDYSFREFSLVDPKGNNVQSYQLEDGSNICYVPAGKKNFLKVPFISHFYRIKDGEVLYKSSIHFKIGDNYGRQYYGLYAESEEAFYLMTSRGFIVANRDSTVYDSYQDDFKEQITAIVPTQSKDILYVGCRDGVYRYNLSKRQWRSILAEKTVSALKYDADLGLLVGTKGEGLFLYNNGTWTNISFGATFVDNVVEQIRFWGNKVFVRTFNDIILLDFHSGKVSGYKKSSNIFFGNGKVQDLLFSNNQPFLIGEDEVVLIDTTIFNYSYRNDFYLRAVSINDEGFSRAKLSEEPLNYKENNLSVRVHLKTLHNNTQNKIRYRLSGLQKGWTETRSKGLSFLGLEPGEYSLDVAAENAIGQWSSPKRLLSFTIALPFYKTWWFAVIVGLSIVLLTWITYYFGTRVSEREKQLLLANITALKRQINPHFVLNALGSIRYYQESNNIDKAENYINRLSHLFSNIVYSSDNKRVLLSDELERIDSYVSLEEERFDGKLSFKLKLEVDAQDLKRYFIPPMLLQPIVENALEHGLKEVENPKLTMFVKKEQNLVIINIKDNGPGLKQDVLAKLDSQKSVGLSNVIKRVELIRQLEGKELSIDLSNDHGLRVVLKIEQ